MIIAFVGHAGAGKTTAAHLLCMHGCYRMRFADPIKAMMAALGVPSGYIDGEGKDRPCPVLFGVTARHAMQTLGDWCAQMHPDFLALALKRQIEHTRDKSGPVDIVVDDCRKLSEAAMLRSMGAVIIRLERTANAGMLSPEAQAHISETESRLIQADHFIFNGGDREELSAALYNVIRNLGSEKGGAECPV